MIKKKVSKKLTLNGLIDLESLGKPTFNFQSDKYKVTDVIVIAHLLADNSVVKTLDCNGSKDKKKEPESDKRTKLDERGATILAEQLKKNSVITELFVNGLIPIENIRTKGEVNMKDKKYEDIDARIVADFLKNEAKITNLDFRENAEVTHEGAKIICKVVMGLIKNKTLQVFGEIPVSKIYQNIEETELKLIKKGLGDSEAFVLAECLEHNTIMTALDIRDNKHIRAESSQKLSDVITKKQSLKIFGTIHLTDLKEEVNLKNRQLGNVEVLVLSHYLKKDKTVKDLNLQLNDNITDVGAMALANGLEGNTTLQKLSLNGEIPLEVFRGEKKKINLSDQGYVDSDAIVIAAFLKNITTIENINLNLKGNKINIAGAKALAEAIDVNSNMYKLTLNGHIWINKFRDGETKELELSQKYYQDIDAIVIGSLLQTNTLLVKLELVGNSISDDGAKAIATGFQDSTVLKKLELSWNEIGDPGAEHIAKALEKNSSISVLGLYLNKIGDIGASHLGSALKINQSLKLLWLDSNEIGDDGAKGLAEGLEVNNTLEILNLHHNKIGSDGANQFSTMLKKNTTLNTLYLYSNLIDDFGASYLADALDWKNPEKYPHNEEKKKFNKTLTALHLYANPKITDKGRKAIKACKPNEHDVNPDTIWKKRTKYHMWI